MKRLIVLFVLLSLLLVGCQKKELEDNIYIFYTSDVHCGANDDIGYDGLKALVDETKAEHEYVTLVDCGDFLQGGTLGTFSKGQYCVDLMNKAGYDIATFGNHEFDYGLDELCQRMSEANFELIASNVKYTGNKENIFKDIPEYTIKEYGPIKVAFLGVMTPQSLTSSTPKYFMEDGEFVYNFYSGNEGQDFYNKVQSVVDEVKKKGADYVVALTHLGSLNDYAPYDSISLISNTSKIDVVLDGHSHSLIVGDRYPNKNGEDVLLSSVGTKLENVGELIIGKDGTIESLIVEDFANKDEEVTKAIEEKQAAINEILAEELCELDYDLMMYDDEGIRFSRSRESTVGNFMADAYRYVLNTDIGFANAGGIRNNILKGTVTYGSLFAVAPFQNTVASIEATGQQILDALEFAARNTEKIYKLDGKAVGECGGLFLTSGLKYTIDTSVESPVVTDGDGFFVEFNGEQRRVKDVYVLQGELYVPLEVDKVYTVAGTNYSLLDSGDGNTILKDCPVIVENGMTDVEALYKYVKEVGFGDNYRNTEGRLIVK